MGYQYLKMAHLLVVLSLCLVSMATAMEGRSDKDDWAYQWYTGEPFRFQCQTSGLNFTGNNYVVWDTPTRKMLPTGHDDEHYKLYTADGIRDVELLIKNVQAEYHGVYTCHMYSDTAKAVGKVIYAINVHDVKHHDMIDKYRHNIIVAVIATAVFICPFATVCMVWQFRYEERDRRKHKGSNGKPYVVDHELKAGPPADGIAESVMSPEGKGAYENLDMSTQL